MSFKNNLELFSLHLMNFVEKQHLLRLLKWIKSEAFMIHITGFWETLFE